eukprot:scaffold40371_cov14-Tisochrysis_lutea.AAC.2
MPQIAVLQKRGLGKDAYVLKEEYAVGDQEGEYGMPLKNLDRNKEYRNRRRGMLPSSTMEMGPHWPEVLSLHPKM